MNRERLSQAIGRFALAWLGLYVMFSLYRTPAIAFPVEFLPSACFFAGGGFGLPYLLLTAILERPFLSRAGIQRDALAISLQATAFSGFVVGAFFLALEVEPFRRLWHWIPGTSFLLFVVGLWGIVTCLKYWYVTRRCRELLPTMWKLIWTANLVTFFAVPTIHQIAAYLGAILENYLWNQSSILFWRWSRYGPSAYNTLIVVSAILFGLSFAWPRFRRQPSPEQNVA
ncbi:MAG: hypothetical protein IAG10_16865 [Planctomycetaceae bacterium]|nr:hypothetical protein [Planctomycetaceae bacterium]